MKDVYKRQHKERIIIGTILSMQGKKRNNLGLRLWKTFRKRGRQRKYCVKRLENIAEDWYNEKKTER